MADSVSQSEVAGKPSTLAKSLAPEDVCVDDYVAPLHETYDFASFFWCFDGALEERSQTVPIRFVASGDGEPLKVKAVCLPFVLVKSPKGKKFTLDVRRTQLARLSREYARVAWNAHKKKRKKKAKATSTEVQKV